MLTDITPVTGRRRLRPAVAALAALLLVTGCGSGAGEGAEDTGQSATTSTAAPSEAADADSADADSAASDSAGAESTTAESAPADSSSASPDSPLDGAVVALDPGHNGGNAGAASEINAPVSDGRGGTKACNTTGTETNAGYAEHAFNWEISELVRERLEDAGAEVVVSRTDDDGVGPCVDERGSFAGDAEADVLVSIHANGTADPSASGFHMIVVEDSPADDAARIEEGSLLFAEAFVESFADEGFDSNPAYGEDGIVPRTDIAGLNHAEVPAVLVECGEMRNAEEAALMDSEAGRERYAEAIVAGIESGLQ